MSKQYLLPNQIDLLNQVRKAREEIAIGGESRGIVFMGASGVGKSYAFKLLKQEMPEGVRGVQRIVPFCDVSAPIKSDATSIARYFLHTLGKPLPMTARLKPNELEAQLYGALDACEVEVVGIQEFHNALLSTSKELRGHLNRLMKNVWNAERSRKRVIIISGTEEIRKVFSSDDELRSRFSCRIPTISLWFDSPDGVRHFRGVATSMAARVGLLDRIGLDDNIVVARLLFACEGHLRLLDSLFTRVVLLARSSGQASNSELLAQAFDEVLAKQPGASNPFRWTEEKLRLEIRGAQKGGPQT
jgi:Bacterial TniB protein